MIKSFFSVLLLITVFSACGNNSQENTNTNGSQEDSPADSDLNLSATQQGQKTLFMQYLDLKDALVAAQAANAADAANKMQHTLDTIYVTSDTASWSKDKAELKSELNTLAAAPGVKEMRQAFSNVSDDYYNAIVKYGIFTPRAYREYCPMAFDSKGAYWLSNDEKIRNPYFGDDMLECGEVRDTL